MNIWANKEARVFLCALALFSLLGIVTTQWLVYRNAARVRQAIVRHDAGLAGYLLQEHPELAPSIPALFTRDKTDAHRRAGQELLAQAGYRPDVRLSLMPAVYDSYRSNKAAFLVLSIAASLALLAAAGLFLKAHYRKIDDYTDDVQRITRAEPPLRLNANGEGSLSKLAAAIQAMNAVLRTHIEREKGSRLFLKDVMTNISHQLKTPLSAMILYAEIMRAEDAGHEVIADFLDKTQNELNRMETLIANLLKLARLDAGIIELNKSDESLPGLIRRAAEGFLERAQREGKTLTLPAGSPLRCSCDKVWMLEALSNLIKNAMEHTAAGDQIAVGLEETPLMVRIIVRDTGSGIHPDDRNHIFKRFYRSRFSQNNQGTGIGLTLAKTIVEMHGGLITVEDAAPKGAVFTIHLPRS